MPNRERLADEPVTIRFAKLVPNELGIARELQRSLDAQEQQLAPHLEQLSNTDLSVRHTYAAQKQRAFSDVCDA